MEVGLRDYWVPFQWNTGYCLVDPLGLYVSIRICWASLIAQFVKNPPVVQKTSISFLGWEDPLEKGLATHSSILGLPLYIAQLVKNPPAMQESWVQSLGWEDPLEKGKATHSVFWSREFH